MTQPAPRRILVAEDDAAAAVDLRALLRHTLDMRERHLRSSGIATELTICETCPGVDGDVHQLQQVFLNVLLNAEQALHHGGSTLRIHCAAEAERSGPAAAAPRRMAAVEFFNDGPPIPAEVLPHIFEPFFTTKPEDEGTGLGLSISRGVLQEHGGSIAVRSDAAGTTFRIELPAVLGSE